MDIERVGRRLFRATGLICLATVVVLSVLPGAERPHILASGNTEHFIAYAGTAFFASSLPRLDGWRTLLLLSSASLAFEGVQLFIPGRSAGLDNWLASTTGALVGIALAAALKTLTRSKRQLASR